MEIIRFMRGRKVTATRALGEVPKEVTKHADATIDSHLYRHLLSRYGMDDIDETIRWLDLGEHTSKTRWGLAPTLFFGPMQEQRQDDEVSRQAAEHGQADQGSEVDRGNKLAGAEDHEADD